MGRNISIIIPTFGMIILLFLCISLSHYYVSINALKTIISKNENDRAELIYFMVESLINKESSKLKSLSEALKHRSDIVDGLSYYTTSDGNISMLKKVINKLLPQLEVDIFQVADIKKKIICSAKDSKKKLGDETVFGVLEAIVADDILIATKFGKGWAIESIVPIYRLSELYGTIILGTRIDDEYAKNISQAIDAQITFGNENGIIASSLKLKKRNFIDIGAIKKSIAKFKPIRIEYPNEFKVVYYSPIEIAHESFCLVLEMDTKSTYQLFKKSKSHIVRISYTIFLNFSTFYSYWRIKAITRKNYYRKHTNINYKLKF